MEDPMDDWKLITASDPPEGVYVLTKIDDERGPRNEQVMRRQGQLWFGRGGMYVYYEPTHFKAVETPSSERPTTGF